MIRTGRRLMNSQVKVNVVIQVVPLKSKEQLTRHSWPLLSKSMYCQQVLLYSVLAAGPALFMFWASLFISRLFRNHLNEQQQQQWTTSVSSKSTLLQLQGPLTDYRSAGNPAVSTGTQDVITECIVHST